MHRFCGVLLGALVLLAGCDDASREQASPPVTLVPVTHAQWQERVPSYAGNARIAATGSYSGAEVRSIRASARIETTSTGSSAEPWP